MSMKKTAVMIPLLLAGAFAAYRGHGNSADVNALLSTYPALKQGGR